MPPTTSAATTDATDDALPDAWVPVAGAVTDPAVLTGYLDWPSFRPGDTLRLHLSAAGDVTARLVRLRHGDVNPAGPGLRQEAVPGGPVVRVPAPGVQPLRPGSWAELVPPAAAPALDGTTLSLWVHPTALREACVCELAEDGRPPLRLLLDDEGHLRLAGAGVTAGARTAEPLVVRTWHLVTLALGPDRTRLTLAQAGTDVLEPLLTGVDVTLDPGSAPRRLDRLILAAARDDDGPGLFFDGRLEAPVLWDGLLADDAVEALLADDEPGAPLVRWDLGRAQGTARVEDEGGRPAGRLVGSPGRAVTGHRWTGDVHLWTHAPEQYAAVHFHRDDLDDARWPVAGELTLPAALDSGVYAVHLTCGEHQDWLTFAVPAAAPDPGRVTVLLPTFTYLAYADEAIFDPHVPQYRDARDAYVKTNALVSLYNYHADGSGVMYAGWRRPLLNLRPDYRYWLTGYPHGPGADLYLLDWLDHAGIAYDVITDHDLHADPSLLSDERRVLVTGSHPEYWSAPMMGALSRWRSRGGRFACLGGNGMDAVVAPLPDRPHVLELRRRCSGIGLWEAEPGESGLSATGETGGLWRFQATNLARQAGLVYTTMGFGRGEGFERLPASYDERAAFVFDGVPDEVIGDFGLWFGGAAGYECDRADVCHGTPQHALVLARSRPFSSAYAPQDNSGENKGEWVFYETRSGGAVFSVGSITWAGSLSHGGYDNPVARVTENVLRRFLDPTPFPPPPRR